MSTLLPYTEVNAIIQATQNRLKQLVPQELIQNWIYYRLKKAGRTVKCYDYVEIPILPTVPQVGKWISRGMTLPSGARARLSMATYSNRYLAVPLTYDEFDEWEQNGNPTQLIKTAELDAAMAAWGMRRLLSNSVLNGIGGVEPDGIMGRILEAAAPAAQTQVVGNINKATKTWWRNQSSQLTSNFGVIAAGTVLPAGILALLNLLDLCTNGTNFPTDLITTKAVFLLVRRAMFEMTSRWAVISEEADVNFGFKVLNLDGAKLAWDPTLAANRVVCTHIGSKKDARRMGENTVQQDGDLEDAGGVASSLLDLDGGLFWIKNPNVNMKLIGERTPTRTTQSTQWNVDSGNIGIARMSDHGVGWSAGTQWETWV